MIIISIIRLKICFIRCDGDFDLMVIYFDHFMHISYIWMFRPAFILLRHLLHFFKVNYIFMLIFTNVFIFITLRNACFKKFTLTCFFGFVFSLEGICLKMGVTQQQMVELLIWNMYSRYVTTIRPCSHWC